MVVWKALCRRQERVLSTTVLHNCTQSPEWHIFLQILCGCLWGTDLKLQQDGTGEWLHIWNLVSAFACALPQPEHLTNVVLGAKSSAGSWAGTGASSWELLAPSCGFRSQKLHHGEGLLSVLRPAHKLLLLIFYTQKSMLTRFFSQCSALRFSHVVGDLVLN